ncbi:MAG: hypothetical protein IPK72_22295 [Candidatus Eisenbacteria bacterium]|nr:hypothetical protein [Candidatus Eisenbacteria bacterium]
MSKVTYNDMVPTFFGFLADTSSSPPNIGAAVAWAAASGLGQTYYGYVQRATMRPFLGDPGMEVFAKVPEPLEVVLPNAVGLGPQTISVTVRGADSLGPVEGAIVTAQRDSVAWATAVTNASGGRLRGLHGAEGHEHPHQRRPSQLLLRGPTRST